MNLDPKDRFALIMLCFLTALAIHGIARGNSVWIWIAVLAITLASFAIMTYRYARSSRNHDEPYDEA